MMVQMVRCKQQVTGGCDNEMRCSVCGLKLCECHGETCAREGHYVFDSRVYCCGCWSKSGDHAVISQRELIKKRLLGGR